MINKILFITLSNIGDAVLTLPVMDALKEKYPQAKITAISGVRPKEIFANNPYICKTIVFNKKAKLLHKIKLLKDLKKERFDLVVDLRNSFLGLYLGAKRMALAAPGALHKKDEHLLRAGFKEAKERQSLFISEKDQEYIEALFKERGIINSQKKVVIAVGTKSHIKRWPKEKFLRLINALDSSWKVILAGDKEDMPIAKFIVENCSRPIADFSGLTSLSQLAYLLKKSTLLLANDSAVLHIGSYLNVPVVAIFGPTDELKYGPWSDESIVVKKDIFCRACEKAQCVLGNLKCINLIKVEDVLNQVRNIMETSVSIGKGHAPGFKRILIVRTDRIGDVLLSTPVITAMRENFPSAYIAVMVSPYSKEIVEGNPYLDELIIYDKDGKHKSWTRSLRFALNLKKKRFDLALVLHPTNRAHLIAFFAGIKRRIGYDRKFGFLLTDKIKHTKQLGQKHESEYALDFIRYLGLNAPHSEPYMPIKQESEKWAEELLAGEGVKKEDKLLAIHPAASCPSKIWPNERFKEVAHKLVLKYGFKVLILAGPKDLKLAQNLEGREKNTYINLAGKTSLSQLASLLKRCNLFISNDSGPVHIASAVGTPVISIFGRSQAGLGPKRWGPRGLKDKILHKETGCIECLAHNCQKQFACLKAITVDDVLNAAAEILK